MSWQKEEGEEVEEGDTLAQVETDKATMDMETPSAGFLAKILVPAGAKDLPLGKVCRSHDFIQLDLLDQIMCEMLFVFFSIERLTASYGAWGLMPCFSSAHA